MKDVPELEGATKLDKNELKLATTLVEQMVTSLAEIDTVDQYHEALKKLIESKIKGKKVVEFEVEEVPRLDIMSALKKSLQASSRKPMVKATPPASKKKALTLVKTEGKPMAKQKAAKKRKAS
jgi:DNA end-binding protein Ku